MEATMDEVGVTLPTDEYTTESAVVADVSNVPSPGQLTPEHVCMEDIGTQLISIESIQQTIRKQVRKLENNSTETTVFELKSLLPTLDGLQSSLRKTFAAHSRPSIRKLHIFQLPYELLMRISENVRGDFNFKEDKYSIAGIKGIKNLRLTCGRLCDASSHLLLHRLDVSLTSSSLEHLDEVSRHPTISKGIRSLQICAGLYRPEPASDLHSFTTEVLEMIRGDYKEDLAYLKTFACWAEEISAYEASNVPSLEDHESLFKSVDNLAKRQKMIRSYANFLRFEASESDEDQNMAVLHQAYKLYDRLFNDQIAFLQNDTFVTIVAEAVARMPTVAGLSITDRLNFESRLPSTEMSDPIYDYVRKSLFRSRPWSPKLISLLPQSPVKLLYQLPLAFIRAGNALTRLCICLEPTTDHELRLSEELVKDLVSAAEHLKVLDIDCQLAIQSSGQARVSKLVSLFLNGTNLRSVTICFGYWHAGRPGEYSNLEPLLALLPWANLRRVSLVSGSFQYGELSKHLEKLKPGTYIHMDAVHLVSGLWADLLDVLRLKADCDSDVRSPIADEDQRLHLGFGSQFTTGGTTSPGTAYIRGQITDNPLRPPPDQDTMDT